MGLIGGGTSHPSSKVEGNVLVPNKCLSYDVSFDWGGDHVITLPAKTCIQIKEYPSTPKKVALFAQQWLQGNKVYDNSFSNIPSCNPLQVINPGETPSRIKCPPLGSLLSNVVIATRLETKVFFWLVF
jgi:hypothetical protein